MAENNTTGETTSVQYRPKPRPRMQSDDKAPPALPVKQSVYSEREVETRLGIVCQSSFPVMPPLPFPSPPELPQRRLPPEPPPRSEERIEGVSAALSKDSDAQQSDESLLRVNTKEPPQPVNTQAENVVAADDSVSTSSAASVSISSTQPQIASAGESGLLDQSETLQMRSQSRHLPDSTKTSGTEGHGVSRFSTAARVSMFVSAAEKAAKSEKLPSIQKPIGRLVVPGGLEEKIASSLARQQTMRTQMEELPDVGIDVTGSEMKKHFMTSPEKKPSRSHHCEHGLDISEDTKSMSIGEVFFC